MSSSKKASVVTPAHAQQFGYIIHIFAKLELDMQIAVAGMLDKDMPFMGAGELQRQCIQSLAGGTSRSWQGRILNCLSY